jgi:hypothetical protein
MAPDSCNSVPAIVPVAVVRRPLDLGNANRQNTVPRRSSMIFEGLMSR